MPDPDLEIMQGWGQLSRPLDKGAVEGGFGTVSPQNILALWASVCSKNKRGGGGV